MKNIVFLLSLIILQINLYAFEMWNGLNSDMNERQLIQRMQQIVNEEPNIRKGINGGKSTNVSFGIFKGNMEHLNRIFPNRSQNLSSIYFVTRNETYRHFDTSPMLYFYRDIFFAVQIPFSYQIEQETLVQGLTNSYGQPIEIIRQTGWNKDNRVTLVYKWETNDKIIYLHPIYEHNRQESDILTIINKSALQAYTNEIEQRNREYELETERRNREANQGLVF